MLDDSDLQRFDESVFLCCCISKSFKIDRCLEVLIENVFWRFQSKRNIYTAGSPKYITLHLSRSQARLGLFIATCRFEIKCWALLMSLINDSKLLKSLV